MAKSIGTSPQLPVSSNSLLLMKLSAIFIALKPVKDNALILELTTRNLFLQSKQQEFAVCFDHDLSSSRCCPLNELSKRIFCAWVQVNFWLFQINQFSRFGCQQGHSNRQRLRETKTSISDTDHITRSMFDAFRQSSNLNFDFRVADFTRLDVPGQSQSAQIFTQLVGFFGRMFLPKAMTLAT